MVTDAKIELFGGNIHCDRYHLLSPAQNVVEQVGTIVHTEEGKAFNGFNNEFIVNQNYDIIAESRIARITLKGMNSIGGTEQPIYCLVNDIEPLRNDKSYVSLEPDSWMNYRARFSLGKQNTLYEITRLLSDYPFMEYGGKFKYFDTNGRITLFPTNNANILVLRHVEGSIEEQREDEDWLYYFKTPDFYMGMWTLFHQFYVNNIDTNEIISVYLSPFELDLDPETAWIHVGNDYLWRLRLDAFQTINVTKVYTNNIIVNNNQYEKTCILDMNGNIVWQSEYKDIGEKTVVARLDIGFDDCKWDCFIRNRSSTSKVEYSPNNRFSIVCNPVSFFADYYQQYINLERSYNVEKRNAQYDKQQLDAIGDVVASTLWHGTSSGQPTKGGKGISQFFPQSSAIATGGAAIGGTIQIAFESYSLGEYNKKITDIENRQAKIQYDKYNAIGSSLMNFICGNTKPCYMNLRVDDATYNSKAVFGNTTDDLLTTYNCRIASSDAMAILRTNPPKYLSGDFDFSAIPLKDALQLNARFKTGIEFVSWL